ncbi:hypothetical protein CEV32_2503 [Brucella rhizosphaerae]|uniref:Uncharacterized protein n=1 Tax=Brucella rhizosphaerae TaxID=571254 RepID=A0A256F5T6_9HYPH|nr:hypothetical protein CEV32_2503 [Brucella rhizosphaerae]
MISRAKTLPQSAAWFLFLTRTLSESRFRFLRMRPFWIAFPQTERHKKNPEKSVNFSGFGITLLSP